MGRREYGQRSLWGLYKKEIDSEDVVGAIRWLHARNVPFGIVGNEGKIPIGIYLANDGKEYNGHGGNWRPALKKAMLSVNCDCLKEFCPERYGD